MEWISLKERQPDNVGAYLVVIGDRYAPDFNVTYRVSISNFWESTEDKHRFWSNPEVTHWMPLPPPPLGDEK
jgi:hypothetical protein